MMKIKNVIVCMLLSAAQFGFASTMRSFGATPERVAQAAQKSIQARGVISSTEDAGLTLDFAAGSTWGRLRITTETGGARVSITTNRVESAWGSAKSPDKALLDGIADDLAGKAIKVDEKSRNKAEEMERRRSQAASVPFVSPGPATVLVRADRETVKSALISECANKGFTIAGESEHQITVSKDAEAAFNLVGRVLFGDAVPRAYRANIQFMLSTESDGTRVRAAAEVLAQNGYGAVARQVVTDDPQAKAAMQSVLDGVKASVENASAQKERVQ